MPWKVVKDEQACPVDKPFAVKNTKTGAVRGRCHPTAAKARDQQKLLYALVAQGKIKMSETRNILQFADTIELGEDGVTWIQALPGKTYQTSLWGEVDVSPEKLDRFVDNFHDNVLMQEVATDYNHGLDPAKGTKASGWIRDVAIRDGDLWYGVEFTDQAKAEIEAGEWKYFSADWRDEWLRDDGEVFEDVLFGGGLTNVPIAKGMVPINFSELVEEKVNIEFAVWTTAYMNNLPDSAFFYVESGSKDSSGKTVPRSKRHFPYKDANGKVDAAHVRNAIARAPQANVPDSVKKSVQSRARAILSKLGGKKMAEDPTAEVAGLEHSEPGTGEVFDNPETNPDDSEGSRHMTLPADNDENPGQSDSLDKQLRIALGLDDDSDIIKAVEDLKDEVGPLREVAKTFSQQKKFSEAFPQEAQELLRLRKERIDTNARKFSEKYAGERIKDSEGKETNKGFSALALERIADTHKRFSEGTAGISDLEGILEAITDKGIVEYGEKGTTRDDEKFEPTSGANARVQFAEVVKARMDSDQIDYEAAIRLAAEEYPQLASAYAQS